MSEVEKVREEVRKLSDVKWLGNMVNDSESLLSSIEKVKSDIINDRTVDYDTVNKAVAEWDKKSLQNEKRIHRALRNYATKIEEIPTENVKSICKCIGVEQKLQRSTVNQAIAEDLLFKGEFEISEKLCREKDKTKFTRVEEQFKNLAYMIHEIKHNSNLQPAVAWSEENSNQLAQIGSDLQFRLQIGAFLNILYSGSHDKYKALQYAQEKFPDYANTNLEGVLDTFSLLIRPDINSDNLEETTNSMNKRIIDELRHDFCTLISKPEQSPLYSSMAAGYIAIPELKKYQAISKKTGKLNWESSDELPVAVKLPKWLKFHPTYICPVSKTEIGKNGEKAAVLECGHIISESAYRQLSGPRNDSNGIKCPYCPAMSFTMQTATFVNI